MNFKEVLSDKTLYGENIDRVEFVETHVSFVVLAGNFAYKFKKNVNFGFLDYSSLEQRQKYCEMEFDLNKQLAPEIYIGTGTLNKDGESYNLNGKGEISEYFVKMHRFDSDNLWSSLAEKNLIGEKEISNLAERIATFHNTAKKSSDPKYFGSLETIKKYFDQNFEQTEVFVKEVWNNKSFEECKLLTEKFFKENANLFEQRINSGKIIEAHGDLHFGNICNYKDAIQIFDRIEFNEEFRNVDPMYDIAFTLMDLDLYGLSDLKSKFIEKYLEITKDEDGMKLLTIYLSRQAYVRGKIACFGLTDLTDEARDSQINKIKKYLDLSHNYLAIRY